MTKTEICNRALGALGHDRTIDDYATDESTEALRCRQFLDTAIKDCLSSHDWDFAAVEKPLGATAANPDGWVRLPYPEDAFRIIVVSTPNGNPLRTRRDRDWLYVKSFGEAMHIRYISSDVEVETFPHKFAEAVVDRLAALLAGPMFGDDKKAQFFINNAAQSLEIAKREEANTTAYHGETENPFIAARG